MEDYRCHEMAVQRRNLRALLLFGFKPLKDDIYNLAFVQGTAEKNQMEDSSKAAKALSQYISVSDSINEPLISRTINLALSEVEHATYLISHNNMHDHTSLDNILKKKFEWVVEFKVSKNFSDTTLVHLRNAIHDYLVCRVLWEWARLTYPKFADYWKEKMEADLDGIREDCERTSSEETARIRPAW